MDGIDEARRRIREEKEQQTGKLDLRGLGLSELATEIGELGHLKELHIGATRDLGGWRISARNAIVDLSPLGRLCGLETLDCSFTRVADLAPLANLQSLQQLDCSATQVADLAPLASLQSLQSLSCFDTHVADLAPLANLRSLRVFICSFTGVANLAPLANLQSLQYLGCTGTHVADLAPLANLQSLQSLDCCHIHLADLAPLANLHLLQDLDCSFTQATDLAPLANLPSLQSLNCSRTKVAGLAPLANLQSLQSLNCSRTQAADLAPLANLPSLQSLSCCDIQVADLTPLANLQSLQSLDCSLTQAADLTPLANLQSLQSLNCSSTQVADLAPLANLQSLRSLDCSSTQVADLAPLANLHLLQDLDCSFTHATDLAPLANLQSLQSLNCSRTQVADLAPLANLQSLQSLNCSSTQVADLAPLANLQSLRSLDCSGTQIADLAPLANPESLLFLNSSYTQVADLAPLARLQSLWALDCSSTRVEDLAPLLHLEQLGELRANASHLLDVPRRLIAKIQKLVLFEASVPGIPGEVLSHDKYDDCLPRLRAHLADLEAGSQEVRRAKLVVLGNGRVGKTQLCRQLHELRFDPAIPSTHGICVSNVPWPALGPEEMLNLWDFGGQDIYHGTHALFMRTRALFLVVWHPDFEHAAEESRDGIRFRNYPLDYWLDYVRTLGHSQSPVIVVQSRCDRPELEAKHLPASTEGFPFFKQCWHSAKADRGRAALTEAISDGVKYLHEREGVAVIGKGRARVIEILEGWRKEDADRPRQERQHRTLGQAEFRQLCENAGGISSPDSLLDYLHQLGVVFCQPGLFLDAIILDQSWALDAVYAVFEREKSFRQIASMGGRFTRSLLDMTVWGEYSQSEQALFLSLMESARVCFVRRKADAKLDLPAEYVAPDLLPHKAAVADQMSGRWSEGEGARIEFDYPFLHSGLMRGLICDAGKLAGDNGVYWKYGVWVYDRDSGSRALIEMRSTGQHGGRICAWVQQGRPERLAGWIRKRFAEQNRRFGYPDLKPGVDELPRVDERSAGKIEAALPHDDGAEGGAKQARPTAAEPLFAALPATEFPRKGPELFISYAWGDDTMEGKRRGAVVEAICGALASKSIRIHRDKADLESGDRIHEFMNRLIEGDLIVAVLSDKYLRSPFCMYELFGIFRQCQERADKFLERVIPIVLPDAKTSRPVDRLKYAAFWKKERDELDQAIRGLDDVVYAGVEIIKEYRLVDQFARNVADMLTYLNDKLMPRDLATMERDGFAEIVRLVGKRGK